MPISLAEIDELRLSRRHRSARQLWLFQVYTSFHAPGSRQHQKPAVDNKGPAARPISLIALAIGKLPSLWNRRPVRRAWQGRVGPETANV